MFCYFYFVCVFLIVVFLLSLKHPHRNTITLMRTLTGGMHPTATEFYSVMFYACSNALLKFRNTSCVFLFAS